jgi:putative chitinase
MIFSSSQVAAALGPKVPAQNIDANWPLVWTALDQYGVDSRACEIAAIATIGVETGAFSPVKERGGPSYFIKLYWENQKKAAELGNKSAEDAVTYRGRGFVQITGRRNYQAYGTLIGRDLIAQPDDALLPVVAAAILATYFRDRRIREAADQGLWERVRRRVNGGLNGWSDFISYVTKLQSLGDPAATGPATSPTAGSAGEPPLTNDGH